MRPRSYLYVPGDSERKLLSAARSSADAVLIDLEDAVAPERMAAARALVGEMLVREDAFGDRQVWVRVALGDELGADLRAVVGTQAVHGFVLAKVESPEDVARADGLLRAMGDDRTSLMPLLESGNAILRAREIASADRVETLQIGEADLTADVGISVDDAESELLFARSMVVFACAAAGVAPPVGPVSTNYTELSLFRESCERLRRLGFAGRACIHPRQVEAVHDALAPSAAEIARAQELVRTFEQAAASGAHVMVGADGQMVDLAVVRQARRLLGEAGL